jgi:hypothetical protein
MDNFLSSFLFLQNQNKNKLYYVIQKFEKLKLKIKNSKNDKIKMNLKKKLTLLASFCLLFVAREPTCKNK